MIESLVEQAPARLRHRSAPLLRERESYLAHLLRRGTSHKRARSIAAYLIHIVRLLGLNRLRAVELQEIDRAAERWAAYTGPHRRKKAGRSAAVCFAREARNWLRFHGNLTIPVVPTHPSDVIVGEFVQHLRQRNGLSTETVKGYSNRAGIFLRWWLDRDGHLSSVTLLDVDAFLAEKAALGWKPRSLATQGQALRSFFTYAAAKGLCASGIEQGIRTPTIPKYSSVPQGPSWKAVRRLLEAAKGTTPAALRASAVLSLCSAYGLRSSEVARLRLTDFNWRDEIFTVERAKRGRLQRYPIQYEVGEAVLRHLTHGRPRCPSRHIFLTLYPPYRPVHASSLWQIVSLRMKQFKIDSGQKGPHALRHACATYLLRKGTALKDIAEFLGHRDARSVGIYAKYDARSLRAVATYRLTGLS
jgi:integrase/recombinase XerD